MLHVIHIQIIYAKKIIKLKKFNGGYFIAVSGCTQHTYTLVNYCPLEQLCWYVLVGSDG